MKTSKAPYPT